MIPYGRQDIRDEDIEAVVEVLRSDYLTQGPCVPRFEHSVCEIVGAAHGVAVSSATAALHVACAALGLGPGGLLWTSPVTFVASANCARYCGADVDFVDIDPRSFDLCADALEAKLVAAERSGRLPDIVVPVHLCGQSCDMRRIHALAQRFGFRIVEDASHAIGGRYDGEPIGSGRFSDVTVFSFHPVKIVTTGEGGMAVTNDGELAARMARLRTHGITRDADLMERPCEGPWYYEQLELGFNYRLTDLQAALGCTQLERLGEYVARREALADRYDELLAPFPVRTPWRDPAGRSAWHLYVVRIPCDGDVPRRVVFERMREAGIGVNVHYIPVHTQPYYAAMGFRPEQFPEAMAYYAEAISLPLHPTLSHDEQDRVVAELARALSR
ncbi:MAG: UDP-4-amino-4,6-dideoxy-N-acetyl-beta-L-altrosamine transaminase [Pseudomonadales bacterium]|nr:UDP-4-amino-4,6-dideoxy-N-acetyl-beta-L-altrosamine transaminase [Pseudomonadales bacterium]